MRPFCADRRTPRTDAVVSIVNSYFFAGADVFLSAHGLEGARQRELAELVPDHLLGDVHRHVLLALCTAIVRPMKSGTTVDRATRCGSASVLAGSAASTFFSRCPSTNGLSQ